MFCSVEQTNYAKYYTNGLHREKTALRTYVTCQHLDAPAHQCSLTGGYVLSCMDDVGPIDISCDQCTDAQSNLSLCWSHMSKGTVSRHAAQINTKFISHYVTSTSLPEY